MKARHLRTRRACFEVLEGRLTLSAASAAVVPAATYEASAAQVAASVADVKPIKHTSSNWSGYAVTAAAGSVSYVSGTWTVPTVSTATDGRLSIWVGIDGYGSKGVEQIGTGAYVSGGQVTYRAWYEMFPADCVYIPSTSMTVNPGDVMTGSVAYVSASNTFVLSLVDVTQSTNFSISLAAPAAPEGPRASAEWIVEAPTTVGAGIQSLANYGTVTFTNAYATIGGTTAQIDNWQSHVIKMAQINNASYSLVSSTSGLTDSTATGLPTGSTGTYSGTVSSFTTTYSAANYWMLAYRTTAHSTATDNTITDDSDDTETDGTMISVTSTQQPHHGWRFGRATNRQRQNPPATPQPNHAQLASTSAQAARDQLFASPGRLI